MGKSRLNASLASRLSVTGGLRSNAMSSAGVSINKRLSLDDARLKLNQTKNTSLKTIKSSSSIRDARELLQKNQKQKEIIKTIINKEPTVSGARAILTTKKQSSEPLMIVTGLANVRKEGDRLKIVRKPEHKVISDGRNTVVVLKNNSVANGAAKVRQIDDRDEDDDVSRFDPANVAPIKIRIDNDHRLSSSVRVAKSREPQEPLFVNKSTKRYTSGHNDYESMDYDDYEQERTVATRLGPSQSTARASSNSQSDNGYRLVVSNLHSKVTEDDILELFSDVGPIKRARFLDKGIAEVVYVKMEHAREAIDKYDRNELDGREMRIELVNEPGSLGIAANIAPQRQPIKYTSNSSKILDHITPSPSQSSTSIFKFNPQPSTSFHNLQSAGELLTHHQQKNGINGPKNWLSNKFGTIDHDFIDHVNLPESKARPTSGRISVDQSIIQHVLFNKNQVVNKAPVTFTVKL